MFYIWRGGTGWFVSKTQPFRACKVRNMKIEWLCCKFASGPVQYCVVRMLPLHTSRNERIVRMSMIPPHTRLRRELEQRRARDPSAQLRKAVMSGSLARLRWTLATGGGVAFCNAQAVPFLHDTIRAGKIRAAQILIKAGMDVNCTTAAGTSPLMAAAEAGRTGLMERLVQAGAKLDAGDKKRATALHYAAAAGLADSYDALIRMGADDQLLDHAGLTAADCATGAMRAHLQAQASMANANRIKAIRHRAARPLK